MTLTTACNINARAKHNLGKGDARKTEMERRFRHCENAMVYLSLKPEDVVNFCNMCMLQRTDIAIIDSGDGGIKNFMTHYFRQLFRKFGKEMTPPEFARVMNNMALDPSSGLYIPAIYHRPNGTLNFYADMLGMTGSMENIIENICAAEKGRYKNLGRAAFRRVYIPTLILYPSDNPSDLERVHILSLYADTLLYNFFYKYDEAKAEGGASMMTALNLIGRCATSISASTVLDMAPNNIGRILYPDRYTDEIITKAEGTVHVDGEEVLSERSATAIGTVGVSLYGLKPFWRMPSTPEGLTYYGAGFVENRDHLSAEALDERTFHFLSGTPKPMDIVRKLPRIYAGEPTNLEGIVDMAARRVDIEEKENMKIIADGSRQTVDKKMTLEIGPMFPFIMLDDRPGSI